MSTFETAGYEQVKRDIVGMFDRAASRYDQVGVNWNRYCADRLVEKLGIPRGARVLDVATGRGALLFPAADKVGPTGFVLGIDLAPNMITHLGAEIAARGLVQARAQVMDADTMVFPDHAFDYILCGFALHFMDYPRLLPRLLRMLRPGGHIGTTQAYFPTDDTDNLARWQWLFDLTREVFPADFKPPASWVAPNRLNRPERAETALRQAGFENISITQEERTIYYADENQWWEWEWSAAPRLWLEGMSTEGLARFQAVAFEKLAAMKSAQGIPIRNGVLLCIANSPR